MGLSGSRRSWFSGIEFLIVALACNSRAGSFVAVACTSERLCSVGLCSSACLLQQKRTLGSQHVGVLILDVQSRTCLAEAGVADSLRMRIELSRFSNGFDAETIF